MVADAMAYGELADAALLERLRAGDERAFATLVARYHPAMLRLAGSFVPSRAVAEEVVQDAWLGVVKGIDRFEGRSSLKTWLFRIVVNRARSTGVRERRERPVEDAEVPAVPADRFSARGEWASPPVPWTDDAEDRIVARETARKVSRYLNLLPDAQRRVVLMRDFEGLGAAAVCEMLGISEGNQRVLLHRGRSRLRNMLEHELGNS